MRYNIIKNNQLMNEKIQREWKWKTKTEGESNIVKERTGGQKI